jgi:hypothetical protein
MGIPDMINLPVSFIRQQKLHVDSGFQAIHQKSMHFDEQKEKLDECL